MKYFYEIGLILINMKYNHESKEINIDRYSKTSAQNKRDKYLHVFIFTCHMDEGSSNGGACILIQ